MKKCTNCGFKDLLDVANFCPFCGARLKSPVRPAPANHCPECGVKLDANGNPRPGGEK